MKSIRLSAVLMILTLSACQRAVDERSVSVPDIRFLPSLAAYGGLEAVGVSSEGESLSAEGGPGLRIRRSEETWGTAGTKSTPVTDLHSSYDVSGYAFLGAWGNQVEPNLFYRARMTRDGSWWSDGTRMVWPGADYNVRFYAVSPSIATGLSWSSATSAGAPVIGYTVEGTVSSQLDILECESADYPGDGSTATGGVNLAFSHAMTALEVKVADVDMALTVKTVSVTGVYDSGSHRLGSGVWTGLTGSATYTVPTYVSVPANSTTGVTSGEQTMILMPQTCPNGAFIIVAVTYGGQDFELKYNLEGEVWAPGKKITYTLSDFDDGWLFSMIDLSGVQTSIPENTATVVATVKSYRQHVSGLRQELPWTLQYSHDGGLTWQGTRAPGMTSDAVVSGNAGGWDGETVSITAEGLGCSILLKVSNSGDSKIIKVNLPGVGLFGGLEIAPGNLCYDGTTFLIDGDWSHYSYGAQHGKVRGSYYFNAPELASFFDSRGDAFDEASGDIDNNGNKVSFGGHDDWRLPTMTELQTLIDGRSPGRNRPGSFVNGHSAAMKHKEVRIEGVYLPGITQETLSGLLIFPDGEIISGETMPSQDNLFHLTTNQLEEFLEQGCVFLPAYGYFNNDINSLYGWQIADNHSGYYYSSSACGKVNGIYSFNLLKFGDQTETDNAGSYLNRASVRLVR